MSAKSSPAESQSLPEPPMAPIPKPTGLLPPVPVPAAIPIPPNEDRSPTEPYDTHNQGLSGSEAPETTQEEYTSPLLGTGPEFESKVEQIMFMGFEREEVVVALRDSFGDADRAVEYLVEGYPGRPVQESSPAVVYAANAETPTADGES